MVILDTVQVLFSLIAPFKRNDNVFSGEITIGDILGILPFGDPMVVIEMDGKSIWDTFESALSMYPAQEGYCKFRSCRVGSTLN